MLSTMQYVKSTSNQGLNLNLLRQWDGISKDNEWTIKVIPSLITLQTLTIKRVSQELKYSEMDHKLWQRVQLKKVVNLSATEVKLYVATSHAQDMLFV